MLNNLFVSNDNFDGNKSHKITKGLVTGAVIVSLSFLSGCSYNADAIVNPNTVLMSPIVPDEQLMESVIPRYKIEQ